MVIFYMNESSLIGKKVLIANRGEIAVRIIKTCKKLGIKTVAVYSDADKNAMHVKLADESFYLGPSNPLKSYLNIERLSEAIKSTGVDAVHPGYGFLAESFDFAKAVENLGVIWIGPPAKALEKLTSKVLSRKIAIDAGVPIIPGTLETVTFEKAQILLEQFKPPIILKADRGGGGKGTRIIHSPEQLTPELFEAVSREAFYAFGNPGIYIEKLLYKPKHIEVQIIVDANGNAYALGERECSIQRRQQKIIEEAPSPAVNDSIRKRIYEYAKQYAIKAGYKNAGTVEFLMDPQGNIYFLEMNKRIQVEHPVTELTTGLDIVELQLLTAFNKELPISNDLYPKGHAVEARIYAEDPSTLIPSPGSITELSIPIESDIRVDHALEVGTYISPYYDPLIAKVISYGYNREIAISKLLNYLFKIKINGIKTNIPFLVNIINKEEFKLGTYDTTTVDFMMREGR